MKFVYICSPYRGDIENNIRKAREYCKMAIKEDCMPICPHIYFTQFLDDNCPDDREKGMELGLDLLSCCEEIWVFGDDVSDGMQKEIDYGHFVLGLPIIKFRGDI